MALPPPKIGKRWASPVHEVDVYIPKKNRHSESVHKMCALAGEGHEWHPENWAQSGGGKGGRGKASTVFNETDAVAGSKALCSRWKGKDGGSTRKRISPPLPKIQLCADPHWGPALPGRCEKCKSQQPDSRTACVITVATQPGMLRKGGAEGGEQGATHPRRWCHGAPPGGAEARGRAPAGRGSGCLYKFEIPWKRSAASAVFVCGRKVSQG